VSDTPTYHCHELMKTLVIKDVVSVNTPKVTILRTNQVRAVHPTKRPLTITVNRMYMTWQLSKNSGNTEIAWSSGH